MRSPTAWWTTAMSPMPSAATSTPARPGVRSAMPSANRPDPAERVLLAVGTASYDCRDFPALDKVPEALRSVVEALKDLGFATVIRSPGYRLDPALAKLRTVVRKAAAAAPVVVVYYTGHGTDLERGTYYLVGKKSRPA